MTGINPLNIIYAGTKRVGSWWNFRNVISPFYRLYYIHSGEAEVVMHGRTYRLASGKLFIIPKFTLHTYRCSEYMDHTYVCFLDDCESGELIYYRDSLECLVDAADYDLQLMNRLLELNPLKSLTYVDPLLYDNGRQHYDRGIIQADRTQTESTGILLQLVSRFMTGRNQPIERTTAERLGRVARYVTHHIAEPISMAELSRLVCLSTDHFSRVFRSITGETPSQYLRRRRVERAQHLLLTSDLSISKIAEDVGIPNLSQFTRTFSNLCGCTPSSYRSRQPEILGITGQTRDVCGADGGCRCRAGAGGRQGREGS